MQIAIGSKKTTERLDARDADATATLIYQSSSDQYTSLSTLYASRPASVTRE